MLSGTMPPAKELIQRDGNSEAAMRKRLAVYQSQTRPLVDYVSSLASGGDADAPRYRCISGTGGVDEITARKCRRLRDELATGDRSFKRTFSWRWGRDGVASTIGRGSEWGLCG